MLPDGWEEPYESDAPSVFARRETPGGIQWLHTDNEHFILRQAGYAVPAWIGDLDKCLEIADQMNKGSDLRIAGMDSYEYYCLFRDGILEAIKGLVSKSPGAVEASREAIGKMEALLRALRERLVDREDTETVASHVEALCSLFQASLIDFWAGLILGSPSAARGALEIMDTQLSVMRARLEESDSATSEGN